MHHALPNHLIGKTALISGASSGIGAAIAQQLGRAGMHVILVARRTENLQAVTEKITAAGGKANFVTADLSVEAECERVAAQVLATWGTPEVLINNAGFGWYGYLQNSEWKNAAEMLHVNVHALTHLTMLFLPAMYQRHSGYILNIGSIVGAMPNQGIALYSGSKAYVDAFTTGLYRELRGSGVHTGVIRPGPVRTEFFDQSKIRPGGQRIPGERFSISAEQVAEAVVSLLRRPRRIIYVPSWIRIGAWAEFYLGWVIDLAGPVLLKRKK